MRHCTLLPTRYLSPSWSCGVAANCLEAASRVETDKASLIALIHLPIRPWPREISPSQCLQHTLSPHDCRPTSSPGSSQSITRSGRVGRSGKDSDSQISGSRHCNTNDISALGPGSGVRYLPLPLPPASYLLEDRQAGTGSPRAAGSSAALSDASHPAIPRASSLLILVNEKQHRRRYRRRRVMACRYLLTYFHHHPGSIPATWVIVQPPAR
ncbi:hypothetical protein JOL62DRAFT_226287 [Phyllosticta paracitricarpa]|uniref:Uncharacterized protein n=1 Tax=Phyllosticta paracitricarpa TaxID=2016321 RepID=A0ABR1NH91_9PEZI